MQRVLQLIWAVRTLNSTVAFMIVSHRSTNAIALTSKGMKGLLLLIGSLRLWNMFVGLVKNNEEDSLRFQLKRDSWNPGCGT